MSEDQGGQSKTLIRGLSILSACADSRRGLTLVQIAEATDLAPSTVHRLLATLESQQFLSVNAETGRWRIGVAGFRMGNAFVRARDYVALLRPLMVELSEETGETVNLAILSGGRALFVSQVESTKMMRMVAPLGSLAPLHASGAGKALLAGLSHDDRDALIADMPFPSLTEHTLVNRDAMVQEVGRIVARGCAYDREEHVEGMRCVAAPVFNEVGYPICALSVSGPSVRIGDAVLDQHARAVNAMGQRATEFLGGQVPSHWVAYV
jgi:IclR family transcriptional regulator, acetate operon repressor